MAEQDDETAADGAVASDETVEVDETEEDPQVQRITELRSSLADKQVKIAEAKARRYAAVEKAQRDHEEQVLARESDRLDRQLAAAEAAATQAEAPQLKTAEIVKLHEKNLKAKAQKLESEGEGKSEDSDDKPKKTETAAERRERLKQERAAKAASENGQEDK